MVRSGDGYVLCCASWELPCIVEPNEGLRLAGRRRTQSRPRCASFFPSKSSGAERTAKKRRNPRRRETQPQAKCNGPARLVAQRAHGGVSGQDPLFPMEPSSQRAPTSKRLKQIPAAISATESPSVYVCVCQALGFQKETPALPGHTWSSAPSPPSCGPHPLRSGVGFIPYHTRYTTPEPRHQL